MGDTFEQSMKKTMSDFDSKILPILKHTYPNMKHVEIEGRAYDEVTRDFDIYAGIDVYRVRPEAGEMIGIASRIQRGKAWRTFTVRKSRDSGAVTEYAKRKRAIQTGTLYPMLTMQAYIDGDSVVIGMVKTKDLIEYIDNYNPQVRRTGQGQKGQAEFYVCPWGDLQAKGYKVSILA